MLDPSATAGASVPSSADLVVTGAAVYRGAAPGHAPAHAVAVRGDRIVAVGTEADVGALVGARTRVVHAPGSLLVPGFQDAHNHAPAAGRDRLHLTLHDQTGRDAYLTAIAAYADTHPQAPWILGGGWAMEHFPGGLPHKDDLDAITRDRPVFLFNRDVHGAWVNSEALRRATIDSRTPDPADGRIERDAGGEPTGMLHEGAAYSVNDHVVPPAGPAEWEAGILNAQEHLHGLGITGWQDAWVTPATLRAYRTLAADGRLTACVVGALWWDRHRGLEQIADLCEQRATGGAGSFHPTTVKIMTDGVLENRTGALLEPYCGGCGQVGDDAGITFVDRDLLAAAVTELDRLGFQVHLHTIGDRAVRNALDAVEAARRANGPTDHRHHLAHIQVVQPQDIPRFRQLGVVANCQTYWAMNDAQLTELTVPFLGPERAALMYPFGDLLRAGTTLAMGSDWAVSTADPLAQMEVATTRVDPADRGGEPFRPDQRLSLGAALDGFTRGSAYVNHDDADAGSIEVGKRADLALIDRDLFDPGSGPIGDAHVELTVASGRVVYQR